MKIFNRQSSAVLLFVVLSAVASSSAFSKPKDRQPNFDKLASKLELSGDQKVQFIDIMQDQHEKRQLLREQRRQEKSAIMEQHRDETLSALSGVLDSEQLEKFEAHMEKRKQKHLQRKEERKNNRSESQ